MATPTSRRRPIATATLWKRGVMRGTNLIGRLRRCAILCLRIRFISVHGTRPLCSPLGLPWLDGAALVLS